MRGYPTRVQDTVQVQRLRSEEASTQMLYDVYANTIGGIEELEKHEEHGMSAGNSGFLSHIIPKHTKKDKEDVIAMIRAQLTILDAQMTFAPPEVTKKARMKLLNTTLKWVAAREEKEIPRGLVDCYAKNVVQVLIKPESMKLPPTEGDSRPACLTEQIVNSVLYKCAQARHQGEQQDKEFHDNSDKKAAMRNTRQGQHEYSGITRLVELDPEDGEFIKALIACDKDIVSLHR
ncbi:hypothetical protein OS493_023803 [Desmophyllum pertusum]|uniref:Uncharacterized protein n=1 Tax=Desmophyllum pertusum TaxID=174260 RepID=A0A9W9YPZ6_9CNID|nr:hypothetical protein OS493_023803 [Desmophyllum pertusum]